MSNWITLHNNTVFNTVGPGIDLEGQNHSLIRNLVILSRQPEGLLNWIAGIKVNLAVGVSLCGNAVAGSERIGFHIRGQECFLDGEYCSENVAHSSLHGIHLYQGDGFQTCTRITGFLSYKNYDYGLMFHLDSSGIVDNVVLVDNTVGLMLVVHCLYAKQCHTGERLIELRNSIIIATSSTFDCISDRIKPHSADLTAKDRPPYNPLRGRVGILWPTFTTVPGQRPDNPWHKTERCPKVLGLMKLKGWSSISTDQTILSLFFLTNYIFPTEVVDFHTRKGTRRENPSLSDINNRIFFSLIQLNNNNNRKKLIDNFHFLNLLQYNYVMYVFYYKYACLLCYFST